MIDDVLESARAFARDELRPVALAYDESEEYPLELVRKAAQLGLTCYDLPAQYGGGGIESLTGVCRVLEELAWGDSPITWVITQGSFFAGPLLATTEQMLLHVDTTAGRASAAPPTVLARVRELVEAHASRPWPDRAGRHIALPSGART